MSQRAQLLFPDAPIRARAEEKLSADPQTDFRHDGKMLSKPVVWGLTVEGPRESHTFFPVYIRGHRRQLVHLYHSLFTRALFPLLQQLMR